MTELNSHNWKCTPPPPALLPVLQKVKTSYLVWNNHYQNLPKLHRYSLGQRIDTLFIEIIEFISIASFLSRDEKQPYVIKAIQKTDTLKVLLMVLWEVKSLDDKKYVSISELMNGIGKMLGGWNGQLIKHKTELINKTKTLPLKGEK